MAHHFISLSLIDQDLLIIVNICKDIKHSTFIGNNVMWKMYSWFHKMYSLSLAEPCLAGRCCCSSGSPSPHTGRGETACVLKQREQTTLSLREATLRYFREQKTLTTIISLGEATLTYFREQTTLTTTESKQSLV